ncbi:MAG: hypothetical protein ACXWK8_05935 [Myxococcaceae bacterium]
MAKRKEVHREFSWTVVRKKSERWPVRVRLGDGDWMDFSLGEAERLGVELIKASRRKSPTRPARRSSSRRRR